jgi:hypothetical protein
MDRNTIIAFRRETTPRAPMINMMALRIKYEFNGTIIKEKCFNAKL